MCRMRLLMCLACALSAPAAVSLAAAPAPEREPAPRFALDADSVREDEAPPLARFTLEEDSALPPSAPRFELRGGNMPKGAPGCDASGVDAIFRDGFEN
jgi:hypothetical protein